MSKNKIKYNKNARKLVGFHLLFKEPHNFTLEADF